VLQEDKLVEKVLEKEKLFLSNLTNISGIKNTRSRGLMIALQFESFEQNKKVIDGLLEEGVFTDWFLFASECLRIVPPLIITDDEIRISSEAIKKVVSYLK
jgi:acetylornithine/succinyldiaminopimelate/putrescine aminotransferase